MSQFSTKISASLICPSASEMSQHLATYLIINAHVYLPHSSKPPVPCNVLSMTQLKTMDLPDQVKALLINGELSLFEPLSFKSNVHYIPLPGAWKVLCLMFFKRPFGWLVLVSGSIYILYVLLCSSAEYFYELCHILASLQGESKCKQRGKILSDATQQNV